MKGDHIFVLCERNMVRFEHHGIDCGDDTVIHFSKATGKGIITRDTMSYFESSSIDGNLYGYEYEQCDSPSVVIQRAMSKLGKGKYDLRANNCEHFAFWCKTGQKDSRQINTAVKVGTFTASTVGTALATLPLTTVAAPGIFGWLGMTVSAPILGIGALPAAAIFGGAFLVLNAITSNNDD